MKTLSELLNLLNSRIQVDFFGRMEGVSTIHLTMKELANCVGNKVSYPFHLFPREQPDLEDVICFLVSNNLVKTDTIDMVRDIQKTIIKCDEFGWKEEDVHFTEMNCNKLSCEIRKLGLHEPG